MHALNSIPAQLYTGTACDQHCLMQERLMHVLLMVTKQVQTEPRAQVSENLQACTACKTGPPPTCLAAAA